MGVLVPGSGNEDGGSVIATPGTEDAVSHQRSSAARAAVLCLTAALLSPGYVLVGVAVLFGLMLGESAVRRRHPWEPTVLDPLIAFWIAAVTVSALLSDHRVLAASNSALLALSTLVAYASVVRTLRERPGFPQALYAWWVAGGVVAGVMVLVHFAHGGTGGRGALPQLGPNATGTVLLIASLLSFALFVSGQGRWRYLCALAQIPILAGLAATETRGAWLGWAVGVVALVVLVGAGASRMRWRMWSAAGVLVAGVLLAGASQPGLVERAHTILDPAGNRDRVLLWQASWRMFEDHPLWGVGFGAFSQVFPRYRLPGDPNEFPPFAHNLPLSLAVETGVFGLLGFILFVSAAVWAGGRAALRGPPDTRMLSIGAVASFAGLMAHQMVDGTLQSFHMAVGFWFLVGVMVALPTHIRHGPRTR